MPYPILAPNSSWYKGTMARSTITEIDIVNTYTPTGNETATWNADVDDTGAIKCYVTGTKLTIAGNGSGKIYANQDSTTAFSSTGSDYFTALTTFNGGNLLDTSKVTSMKDMFRLAKNLKTVDVSNWDVSNVTSMYRTFSGSNGNFMSLQTLDVSKWNVSKVSDFSATFQYCSDLASLDVSNWDTSSATIMMYMFYLCSKLTSLDVSDWDTSKVTTMLAMFYSCTSLETLNVSNWNTGEVTNMSYMFKDCTSLEELDVSNWNTGKVTTFRSMFAGNDYSGDMKFTNLDVKNWDTSSATNMSYMFYGCGQLTKLDLSAKTVSSDENVYTAWNVSKVTEMSHMFADCFKMKNYNFFGWDTTSLTNMDGMFNDNRELIFIDVSAFDTSNVTIMCQVFENCSNLIELDLSNWDTSSVFVMTEMFFGCSNLIAIYVSDKWTTSALQDGVTGAGVGYKDSIFNNCIKLVGDNGTVYDASHTDYIYARIDGGLENPGYLTDIQDSYEFLIKSSTLRKIGMPIRKITGDTSKYYPSEMAGTLNSVNMELLTQADIIEQIISILTEKFGQNINNI